MRAIYITAGIAFLLTLLAFTRHGAAAGYSSDGIFAEAKIWLVRFRVYPPRKREEPEEPGKKKKKKKKKKPEDAEKGGALENLKPMLPAVRIALGSLRHRLSIDLLTVRYTAAGADDPCAAALAFGGASAAFGLLIPFLENCFTIKERDLRADADFSAREPSVYIRIQLTLRLWEIAYIGVRFALALLRVRTGSNNRKVES